jgi:Tol biopolymer transport system component
MERERDMSFRVAQARFLAWVVMGAGVVAMATVAAPADATYAGRDGRIAFVRSDQIYTMNAAGASVRKLTSSGMNYRPKWSPDGRRISYIHEVDGRKDVWVMGAYGRGKRAVTRTGNVTSAGATWSPDGQTLALALDGQLHSVGSTPPFGSQTPTPLLGYGTGGFCEGDELRPVYVDQFLAWSPDGTRIAIFNHDDCQLDDRIDWYFPATGERRTYAASGADCCGYLDWSELFWGPGNQFGYSERDTGPYGEDVNAPSRIVYPGFQSRNGDTGGAPSPSGSYLALTTASSGTPRIIRANADGTGRRVLGLGSQPDWQALP